MKIKIIFNKEKPKKNLTSVSLCVAERLVAKPLEPFVLSVFEALSLLCLPPATLPGLVSAIVAPFFAALSSFFCGLAASFASVYSSESHQQKKLKSHHSIRTNFASISSCICFSFGWQRCRCNTRFFSSHTYRT